MTPGREGEASDLTRDIRSETQVRIEKLVLDEEQSRRQADELEASSKHLPGQDARIGTGETIGEVFEDSVEFIRSCADKLRDHTDLDRAEPIGEEPE